MPGVGYRLLWTDCSSCDLSHVLAEVWFCQLQRVSVTVWHLEFWKLFKWYINARALVCRVDDCWSFRGVGCGLLVVLLLNVCTPYGRSAYRIQKRVHYTPEWGLTVVKHREGTGNWTQFLHKICRCSSLPNLFSSPKSSILEADEGRLSQVWGHLGFIWVQDPSQIRR